MTIECTLNHVACADEALSLFVRFARGCGYSTDGIYNVMRDAVCEHDEMNAKT